MFALIIVACIATIALLGNSMGNLFASLADTFSDSA
jgi:Flp pilus assembly pilin Flp